MLLIKKSGQILFILVVAICFCNGILRSVYANDSETEVLSQKQSFATDTVTSPGLNLLGKIDPPLSLGQPSRHTFQWGIMVGYSYQENHTEYKLFIADHTMVGLPQVGGVRFTAEAALQKGRDWVGATAGLFGTLFGIQNGFEFDTHREKLVYRLALNIVARRGGLGNSGDRLRVEWVPATKTVQLGVTIRAPWQKWRRNRPLYDHVKMPTVNTYISEPRNYTSAASVKISLVKEAISQMDFLLTPRLIFDVDSHKWSKKFHRNAQSLRDHISDGTNSFLIQDSIYHHELREAFTDIANGVTETGRILADFAEKTILKEVVFPFNRLFGQNKKPFNFSSLANRAETAFSDGVAAQFSSFTTEQAKAASFIFVQVVDEIIKTADNARQRWDDEKLVWLPLNLGLQPEQYDSQKELNKIIGALFEQPMVEANQISLLHNDLGYLEFEKLVLQTKYYHVFLIHDISGKYRGEPDIFTWRLIINGYIEAFINAIEEMETGCRDRLPQFMIFLDQFYYEKNQSRYVLDFLENLLNPGSMKFGDEELEKELTVAHRRLLKAISESKVLSNLSEKELSEKIKVFVNITNVFDPTYTKDAVARDHRKIAFRDVFEEEPGIGAALISGMGVGSLYVSACWDDRSVLIRGPALVSIKSAARELFLGQGFDSTEVPYYLQARDYPEGYWEKCTALREMGWTTSLIAVFNQTGFGRKQATILKVALYNLMLPGSVIIIPDSIWSSDYWGSMLAAASLRGCRIFIIAPAKKNAPSDASVTIETVRKTLKALTYLAQLFESEISEAGGMLKVGLYKKETDVGNISAELKELIESCEAGVDLYQTLCFDQETLDSLGKFRKQSSATTDSSVSKLAASESECLPKLHFKTHCLIGNDALNLIQSSEFAAVMSNYCRQRLRQTDDSANPAGVTPRILESLLSNSDSILDSDSVNISNNRLDDLICVYTVGSHNEDRRSMLLDGEALVYVAGEESMIGAIDLIFLLGSVEWISDPCQINEEFPRAGGLLRAIARFIKNWI